MSQTTNAYNSLGTRAYTNRPASSSIYTYDAVARLSQLGQHFVSSASNLEQGSGYNNASQITTATRDNDAFVFDGLVAVNRNYTVNGLNQYTAVGALPAFQYDDNGNLTYDGSNSYAYDAENRLVRVTGARTANLVYDPLGRLLQVDEGTSGTTSLFLYDGDNLAAEYAGDGAAMSKRYVFGRGVDEPIAEATGSLLDCSSAKFLHADNQGSIIARADCSGNIVNRNTYDEWGIPGTGNAGRFQYTGQMWMPEIGMYYYKARICSPTLGRFLQTDAIGYKDQINLYAYVGNDPVNGTDPSGQTCVNPNSDPCKAPPLPRRPAAAPVAAESPPASKTGNITYNETGGLRGAGLHEARVAVAHVIDNRREAGVKEIPGKTIAKDTVSPSERNNDQYRDSQNAASEAARSTDTTGGSKNFYIDYGQSQPEWAKGKDTTSFGPFTNQAGHGDVPTGAEVRIIIVHPENH